MKKAIGASEFHPITRSGRAAAALMSALLLATPAAAAEPETPGADFTSPVTVRDVTRTQVIVASLTLDVPGPGVVVVNSSGYTVFNTSPASLVCAITKSNNVSHEPQLYAQGHNEPNAKRIPIAATRGFREKDPGPQTYNFVCGASLGGMDLVDVVMTAVYVPKRY